MSAQQNKALILDYFATLGGTGSGRPLGVFFAEDVTWQIPQSNPVIQPNPRRGHAAVMDLLTAGVGTYKAGTLHIELQRVLADDTQVGAQFTLSAQLANGNDYTNQYFFLFSIAADKITGIWEYLDTLYQMQRGAFDEPV